MKEIIITGASGFIGSNLSPYLSKQGFKITKLSLREKEWKTSISKDAFAIIHLAGIASDGKQHSEEDYHSVNYLLCKELYDHFLACNIKKFFFFSSVKAAAEGELQDILEESYEPKPVSNYGKSKLLAEQYLLENLPWKQSVFVIRPCIVHGPKNRGNINLLYKFVNMGIPYPLASFENQRSFLSIDNLNFLIDQMCTKEIKSGIYNLSDTGSISTVQLIEIISQVLNKNIFLCKVNKKLVSGVAKILRTIGLPVFKKTLNKLTGNYTVSNNKILTELQVNLPLSIEEGIKQTVISFRKNKIY